MATDIIARGMITEYKSGTNIDFKENEDGSVTISASGNVSSEDTVARGAIDNHKLDKNNPHNVTAEQVGLGNVNNTADLDKPISTAVQKAIDNKADKTVATTSADGLMSAEDKVKLDSVDDTYALKSLYGDTTINVGRQNGSVVGDCSVAVGKDSVASGYASHAEGSNTKTWIGSTSTLSDRTVAIDDNTTVIVSGTQAYGRNSHAEGCQSLSYGENSHAEGTSSAIGWGSHSEGGLTKAEGEYSHAEGRDTLASGRDSHAGGTGTKALHTSEVAYGRYNLSNSDTLFSVGDGTSDSARHNAFEITTTGGKLHDKDIATTDMSLPANGGNADTVDGKHASDFKAYQRYAPVYNGDLLDMTEMGTYSCCVPDVTNTPSSIPGWCYVTMIQFRDAGYRRYICVPLNNAPTSANELYLASEYVRDSEGKLIWRNISDGGKAYTISEWGTRVISDLNNAELGFTAAAGNAGHLNAPNSFWSTVLTTGSNTAAAFRSQFAIPWSNESSSQVLKYRVMNNNTWYDWKEIYTSGNKPYVTGSVTVAANSQICVTNHGFIPSAVIWWDGNSSGVAVSFNETQFNINIASTDARTVNYLIFK